MPPYQELGYTKVLLDSDDDDEVVKDKLSLNSPLGGIKIKGRAKDEENGKRKKENTLKQDIAMYLHVKKRIDVHLKTRQEKLQAIIPQVKEDLKIIRRKHNDINSYNIAKEKYIGQFIPQKHTAKAFIKKHLRNI